MTQFSITPTTDVSLLRQVGRATYEPYYQHVWHSGGVPWYMDKCFGDAALAADLADPNCAYFIARDAAGEIVGILKLLLLKPLPDGGIANALYLEKIYLMPNFFGQGAGQKLIDFVLEMARSLGREAVWLMVMKTGPVKAYEKAGFHICGETYWNFELLKPAQREGWVMEKRISEV